VTTTRKKWYAHVPTWASEENNASLSEDCVVAGFQLHSPVTASDGAGTWLIRERLSVQTDTEFGAVSASAKVSTLSAKTIQRMAVCE